MVKPLKSTRKWTEFIKNRLDFESSFPRIFQHRVRQRETRGPLRGPPTEFGRVSRRRKPLSEVALVQGQLWPFDLRPDGGSTGKVASAQKGPEEELLHLGPDSDRVLRSGFSIQRPLEPWKCRGKVFIQREFLSWFWTILIASEIHIVPRQHYNLW